MLKKIIHIVLDVHLFFVLENETILKVECLIISLKKFYHLSNIEGCVLDDAFNTKSNFIDIARHTQEVSIGVKLYYR